MKYIKVRWVHDLPDEPELLYSEIDHDRNEIRKVEIFKDGTMGYAASGVRHRSALAECPLPTVEEIGGDPQFKPESIAEAEFAEVWERAARLPPGAGDL